MPMPSKLRSSLITGVLSLLLVCLVAVPAQGLELSMPLLCDYGEDCFIQQYPDTVSGPVARDFDCGYLTYDGHKGTDFRVPWANYIKGVEVVAAAPGIVLRIRDEMEDKDVRSNEESVDGREAGNAVVLGHGQGYETIYSHLKKGSVRVHPGEKVKRGQVLGLVGLSGLTMFTHLHFGVSHLGSPVCPYKGYKATQNGLCGETSRSLWKREVLEAMPYTPTGEISSGFYTHRPSLPEVVRQQPVLSIPTDAPVLVYAVTVYGVQPGDTLKIQIVGPTGEVFAKSEKPCTKHQAQRLLFTGRKLGKGRLWTRGEYRGEYEIVRKGKVVVKVSGSTTVR